MLLPALRVVTPRRRRGKLINITPVHADNPNPEGADYDCSKGAVRMPTRTLALELATHANNVNSLAGHGAHPVNQAAIDDPIC